MINFYKPIFCSLLFLLVSIGLYAQAPKKISYQAVVRNNTNKLVVSQRVGVRISILQGSANGSTVYAETQAPTSNANGLISFEIGSGTVVSGAFSGINWGNGTYFVKTETDPNGGSNYDIVGISQLMSVPYALYAESSGSSTPGPKGEAGAAGAKGDKGDKGDTGSAGATGLPGAVGATGATGAKGDKGDKGDTGSAGATGLPGAVGATGATGAKGDKGDKGDTGSTGLPGAVGATGVKGDKGDKGDTGSAGAPGLPGAVGPTGAAGVKGDKGDKGDTGAAGEAGPKGDKGDTGTGLPNGTAGAQIYLTGSAAPFAAQSPATVTGDVTLSSNAVTTIVANAVTTTKLADASVTTQKISATGQAGSSTYLRGDGTWAAPASSGAASLQVFATSTVSQLKRTFAYSRYTFNYNNKMSGASQAAWTGNTFTVPSDMAGIYNINLCMVVTDIGSFNSYIPYPEIQVTSGATVRYYYGAGSGYSALLSGNGTDETSANTSTVDQHKSFSRGTLNATIPLLAGDVVKIFYRGNASSNSATAQVDFSTDGSSYLSIVKLN